MVNGRSMFLDILGVENSYGTLSASHIQLRRRNERTPFAEILDIKGQSILRVGNPYPESNAVKIVVDED